MTTTTGQGRCDSSCVVTGECGCYEAPAPTLAESFKREAQARRAEIERQQKKEFEEAVKYNYTKCLSEVLNSATEGCFNCEVSILTEDGEVLSGLVTRVVDKLFKDGFGVSVLRVALPTVEIRWA